MRRWGCAGRSCPSHSTSRRPAIWPEPQPQPERGLGTSPEPHLGWPPGPLWPVATTQRPAGSAHTEQQRQPN
jgi:hypothetical protein